MFLKWNFKNVFLQNDKNDFRHIEKFTPKPKRLNKQKTKKKCKLGNGFSFIKREIELEATWRFLFR